MPRASTKTDGELLQAVAGKDRHAFEALYQRYHRRLFGYLLRQLQQPELAEEVLDDVMFVVWTDAAKFRGAARPSTWIFGIAHRKAMKAWARAARRRIEVTDEGALEQAPAAENTLRRKELRWLLEKALAVLSPEHRAVVELTYFQDCSYREVAAIVGCPVNTVKTRMFHARKRLRDILPRLGRPVA